MSVLIKKCGILSTVQDLGRTSFRRFGINPNGAMDKAAARLINILLGNDEGEAILEMHFPAPTMIFQKPAVIALGGADFGAKIDDNAIENWRLVYVASNQTLNFAEKIFGNRAYLSVKGGFAVEKWLGSASTNLTAEIGGFEGRKLANGDELLFNSKIENQKSNFPYKISKSLIPLYSSFPTARVTAGAEFERLTASSRENFLSRNFTISNASNRMGFRLTGEPLCLRDKIELVSSAVDFGTIQLLPDGQLIILMADAQTSGGYPRLAHIVSKDLPVLSQLGAGDKVCFNLISIEEAENLMTEFEKNLNWLRIGVNSKYAFER